MEIFEQTFPENVFVFTVDNRRLILLCFSDDSQENYCKPRIILINTIWTYVGVEELDDKIRDI